MTRLEMAAGFLVGNYLTVPKGKGMWNFLALTFCLMVGSIVLAPAIVFSYAVKAADRADRDGSW